MVGVYGHRSRFFIHHEAELVVAGAQAALDQEQRSHGLFVLAQLREDGHGQHVAGLVGGALVAEAVGVELGRLHGEIDLVAAVGQLLARGGGHAVVE